MLATLIIILALCVIILLLTSEVIKKENMNVVLKEDVRAYRELAKQLEQACNDIPNEDGYFHGEYCVSESDTEKYSSDEQMEKAIRKHLANVLARDIMKEIPVCKDGNKYSYSVKVKQVV